MTLHREQLCFVLVLIIVQHICDASFVPKGRKCRLQEQHCDIMHPEKQCCPGTSCGVRLVNHNLVNICQMCRDIGQPCTGAPTTCCKGLRCQKVTQHASMCNPIDYKFFADEQTDDDSARSRLRPAGRTTVRKSNPNHTH